ncbi:MAG: hypothetical protein QXK37_05405 [Candidatus Woesearchaeota archaeon]
MRIRQVSMVLMGLLLCTLAYAETMDVVVDCWNSAGCNLCGDEYYYCRTWGGFLEQCSFQDPLPNGATLTKVEVTPMGAMCGYVEVAPTIEGTEVGDGSMTGECSCDTCDSFTIESSEYPSGFPNYNYGGTNVLNLNSGGDGLFCLSKVKLTLHYEEKPIPEFTAIAAGVALVGAGAGYLLLRRRK